MVNRKDYWMHIGILFSCQELYSVVRKSILLTVPFSLPCRDVIQISECTHRHRSHGPMWHLLSASPPQQPRQAAGKKELIPGSQELATRC